MKHQARPPAPHEPAIDAHHCACGALLARWVEAGLELKCRRCKRLVMIRFPEPGNVIKPSP